MYSAILLHVQLRSIAYILSEFPRRPSLPMHAAFKRTCEIETPQNGLEMIKVQSSHNHTVSCTGVMNESLEAKDNKECLNS